MNPLSVNGFIAEASKLGYKLDPKANKLLARELIQDAIDNHYDNGFAGTIGELVQKELDDGLLGLGFIKAG